MLGRKRDLYVEGLFALVLGLADEFEEERQRSRERLKRQAAVRGGGSGGGGGDSKTSGVADDDDEQEDGAAFDDATTQRNINNVLRMGAAGPKKAALSYDDFVRTCMTCVYASIATERLVLVHASFLPARSPCSSSLAFNESHT